MRVIRATLFSVLTGVQLVPLTNDVARAQTPGAAAQTGSQLVNGLLMSIAQGDVMLHTGNVMRIKASFQNLPTQNMPLVLGAGYGSDYNFHMAASP